MKTGEEGEVDFDLIEEVRKVWKAHKTGEGEVKGAREMKNQQESS